MKVTAKLTAVITMMAIVFTTFIAALPASAATYHNVYYTAGNVDNVVGSKTFTLACLEGKNFEFANGSRFSRKGYKLSSWYIKTTGQHVGLESTYNMPAHDLDVEAVWTPAVYSIGFAGVGGVTADGNKNVYVNATYGTKMTLPENPFTYDGYTFKGWDYEGIVYQAGASFEIPAVMTGEKIVLAAVWGKGTVTTTPAVTTAITTTEETTTTTTTTFEETTTTTTTPLVLADNQKIKTFNADHSFTYANEIFKTRLYNIIDNGDMLDKLMFNFESSKNIGMVNFTVNTTLMNGSVYEKNFSGEVNGNSIVFDYADAETCSLMGYAKAIQIGVWYSESFPLTLKSIEAVVREPEVTTKATRATEETTTTTTTEETTTTTTTEETTTTTTTEETTTTTTTEETTTTTTTEMTTTTEITTPFVFVVAENEVTTVTENSKNTFSREVVIDDEVVRGDTFSVNAMDLVKGRDVVESFEITISSDDGMINSYNMSAFMNMADGSIFQKNVSGHTVGSYTTFKVEIDSANQKLMGKNSMVSFGYWYGDNTALRIESIKVNYRIDKGDFDNDGVITASDVNILKQALVGKVQLSSSECDINNDGNVNVFDSIILERAI